MFTSVKILVYYTYFGQPNIFCTLWNIYFTNKYTNISYCRLFSVNY